ncbi:MFS transporter small subunit [Mycobacterium sp. SMC-4]|uniref:MFS transporter small subunit n=1 Tax=Mycobacterium sp. SMC-4 TaxID=2857059 RepID=UPI003D05AEDF
MTTPHPETELHEYTPTVPKVYIVLAWVWVGIPFAYGLYELLLKAGRLFGA